MAQTQQTISPSLDDFESRFEKTLHRAMTDPTYMEEVTPPPVGNPITLGTPVISAEDWANKQVKNASAAASDWLKNVKRPRRNPKEAALAASAKREQKVRTSLEKKKWDKAMANVDLDQMMAVIDAVGAEGYRRGIEARKVKVAARTKELQPMVTALKKEIEAMPDATDADREARLLAARRGMIKIGEMRRGI